MTQPLTSYIESSFYFSLQPSTLSLEQSIIVFELDLTSTVLKGRYHFTDVFSTFFPVSVDLHSIS